jgi:FMN phosphatase YigB (HAD superfamily)
VNTFKPFLGKDVGKFSRNHSRIKQANAGLLQVPEQLVNELLKRFSSSKGYTMFPDVIPFFKNLKDVKQGNATDYHWPWEKTVVGIITNSDSRVPGILRDLGLKVGHRRVGNTNNHIKNKETDEADIDFVVLSYDVGAEKPDTRIFNAAEDMLKEMIAADESNIQAQSIDDFEKLYVGDDVEKDYYGARAAGWHALTVDAAPREQHYNRMDPQAIKGAKWALRPYKPKTEDENLNQQKAWRVLDLTALRHWDPSVYERETFVPKNEEQVPTADAVTSK